jgi:hypothetical protein
MGDFGVARRQRPSERYWCFLQGSLLPRPPTERATPANPPRPKAPGTVQSSGECSRTCRAIRLGVPAPAPHQSNPPRFPLARPLPEPRPLTLRRATLRRRAPLPPARGAQQPRHPSLRPPRTPPPRTPPPRTPRHRQRLLPRRAPPRKGPLPKMLPRRAPRQGVPRRRPPRPGARPTAQPRTEPVPGSPAGLLYQQRPSRSPGGRARVSPTPPKVGRPQQPKQAPPAPAPRKLPDIPRLQGRRPPATR